MAISKFDEWLIAENIDGSRQYIIHTLTPRFIGEILDTANGGNEVKELEWIDPPPQDVSEAARLMRQTGDAIAEYDLILEEERPDDEDEG